MFYFSRISVLGNGQGLRKPVPIRGLARCFTFECWSVLHYPSAGAAKNLSTFNQIGQGGQEALAIDPASMYYTLEQVKSGVCERKVLSQKTLGGYCWLKLDFPYSDIMLILHE
jgi:hypothetical protein